MALIVSTGIEAKSYAQKRVSLKSSRRGWYTYQVGDRKVTSRIEPPDGFDGEMDGVDSPPVRE